MFVTQTSSEVHQRQGANTAARQSLDHPRPDPTYANDRNMRPSKSIQPFPADQAADPTEALRVVIHQPNSSRKIRAASTSWHNCGKPRRGSPRPRSQGAKPQSGFRVILSASKNFSALRTRRAMVAAWSIARRHIDAAEPDFKIRPQLAKNRHVAASGAVNSIVR